MLKRLIWFITITVLAFFTLAATPAYADGGSRAAPLLLSSWPVILAGIFGVISSHATELLTHTRAPQWIKSGTNLAFSTLAGIIITVQTVAGHTWKDYAAEIGVAWVLSMFTHYTGITAWIQNAIPGGIGGNVAPLVGPAPVPPDVGTGAA